MKQIPLFSLVIFPTDEQSTLIKYYKQKLKATIGWFGSANAAAHITVINFNDENELLLFLNLIREFCKTCAPQKVTFNAWNFFGEQTFFVAPDNSSQEYLNNLIISLHNYLGFKTNTINAHLTIARGLDSPKMKAANQLFKNEKINLQFKCDALYLRRFNYQTKQYSDIVEKIRFKE
jgi:hypothetical protein